MVHYSIPHSLEGYYQETGRAGRDGKDSLCVLFYAYRDSFQVKKQIDDGEGSRSQKEVKAKEEEDVCVRVCV